MLEKSVPHGKFLVKQSTERSHWLVGTVIFCLPLVSPMRRSSIGSHRQMLPLQWLSEGHSGQRGQEAQALPCSGQKVPGGERSRSQPRVKTRKQWVPTTKGRWTPAGLLTRRPAPSSGFWASRAELGFTCTLRSRACPGLPASLPLPKAGDPSRGLLRQVVFPGGHPGLSMLICPLGLGTAQLARVIPHGGLPQISVLQLPLLPCLSHPSPSPASLPLGSWRVLALLDHLGSRPQSQPSEPPSQPTPLVSKPCGSGTVWSRLGHGGENRDAEAALASLHPDTSPHMSPNLCGSCFILLLVHPSSSPGVLGTQTWPPLPENPRTLSRRNPEVNLCLQVS